MPINRINSVQPSPGVVLSRRRKAALTLQRQGVNLLVGSVDPGRRRSRELRNINKNSPLVWRLKIELIQPMMDKVEGVTEVVADVLGGSQVLRRPSQRSRRKRGGRAAPVLEAPAPFFPAVQVRRPRRRIILETVYYPGTGYDDDRNRTALGRREHARQVARELALERREREFQRRYGSQFPFLDARFIYDGTERSSAIVGANRGWSQEWARHPGGWKYSSEYAAYAWHSEFVPPPARWSAPGRHNDAPMFKKSEPSVAGSSKPKFKRPAWMRD